MNSIIDVLDVEEPPPSLEMDGPYGLIHTSDVSYALDDLLRDAATVGSGRDYTPLDALGVMLSHIYDLDLSSTDYDLAVTEDVSEIDPYAAVTAEPVEDTGSAVVDFTDYLTRRYVDTSVSFPEGSQEEVQDYLQYLGRRSRSLWGSY